jgi:hypothetical protein
LQSNYVEQKTIVGEIERSKPDKFKTEDDALPIKFQYMVANHNE